MKKTMWFFLFSLLTSSSLFCALSEPVWAPCIPLLANPNLSKKFSEKFPSIAPYKILKNSQFLDQFEEACLGGRQIPRIGFDLIRRETSTGRITDKPSCIVLTFSGKNTLQKTIVNLQEHNYAHNFIINLAGGIHPVCMHGEEMQKPVDIKKLLSRRLHALGISCVVEDGYRQQVDMNSTSISISVVGTGEQPVTEGQEQSLIHLIAWLQQQYGIRPDQVKDYGLVACDINRIVGRRNPNPNLPWEKLQSLQLATYPNFADFADITILINDPEEQTKFASGAANKLGMCCPETIDRDHEVFRAVLAAFQKHAKADVQDGTLTDMTLKMLVSMVAQHDYWNPKLRKIVPLLLHQFPTELPQK
jgi:N-acetyl-anhydromuramyl-L-alanine amidase AmpD